MRTLNAYLSGVTTGTLLVLSCVVLGQANPANQPTSTVELSSDTRSSQWTEQRPTVWLVGTSGTNTYPTRTKWMRTSCNEEDGWDCYWNAHEFGNGHGHSFYIAKAPLYDAHDGRVGRVVCVYFVATKYDNRHGGCHILPRRSDGGFS